MAAMPFRLITRLAEGSAIWHSSISTDGTAYNVTDYWLVDSQLHFHHGRGGRCKSRRATPSTSTSSICRRPSTPTHSAASVSSSAMSPSSSSCATTPPPARSPACKMPRRLAAALRQLQHYSNRNSSIGHPLPDGSRSLMCARTSPSKLSPLRGNCCARKSETSVGGFGRHHGDEQPGNEQQSGILSCRFNLTT